MSSKTRAKAPQYKWVTVTLGPLPIKAAQKIAKDSGRYLDTAISFL